MDERLRRVFARNEEREFSLSGMCLCMCMCAWSVPSAPQDLLLLVYKRVQSVKLLLLRVRQSFAKVASGKTLQDNGSANVSQIKFGYSQARILLNRTKKGEKQNIAHYRKEICLYSKFFNDSIRVAKTNSDSNHNIYLFVEVFLFYK